MPLEIYKTNSPVLTAAMRSCEVTRVMGQTVHCSFFSKYDCYLQVMFIFIGLVSFNQCHLLRVIFKVLEVFSWLVRKHSVFPKAPPLQTLFTFSSLCRVRPSPPPNLAKPPFPLRARISHCPTSLGRVSSFPFRLSEPLLCHFLYLSGALHSFFMSVLLGCEYHEGKLHVVLFPMGYRIDSNPLKTFSC